MAYITARSNTGIALRPDHTQPSGLGHDGFHGKAKGVRQEENSGTTVLLPKSLSHWFRTNSSPWPLMCLALRSSPADILTAPHLWEPFPASPPPPPPEEPSGWPSLEIQGVGPCPIPSPGPWAPKGDLASPDCLSLKACASEHAQCVCVSTVHMCIDTRGL